MIIVGNARGGATALADHLTRLDENEHVELHQVRGFVSGDLHGALTEAYAVSRGTRCQKFLFSVSLNPPQSENPSLEVFEGAAARIEDRLGLGGQPRAIVFHEKEGRRHAHIVWSRIDAKTMKAVELPFYKQKLNAVSKEIFLEQGWTLPPGYQARKQRDPRNFTLAEWQQAKRTSRNAGELKGAIQEAWNISDSKAGFKAALKERGFALARGDRRGHVVLTTEGEVFSLARSIGKKTKEVRARLGEPDALPGVAEAKAQIAKDMASTMGRLLDEARAQHAQRMKPLDIRRKAMTQKHRAERNALDQKQNERWQAEARQRSKQYSKGLKSIWQRLNGERMRIRAENERQAYADLKRDQNQRHQLITAQRAERARLQAEIHAARKRHTALIAQIYKEQGRYREQEKRAHIHSLSSRFAELGKTAAPSKRSRNRGPDFSR